MSKLLIINNHDSFTYNLVDLIRRLQTPFQVINVEDAHSKAVENFSHILISPGPDIPTSYPQLFEILEKYHKKRTFLGVCLGHQTLCQFFGATLYNLAPVRHGQAHRLKVRSKSPLFLQLPEQFQIGLYHSWAVSTQHFPADLEITATCEQDLIMAVQHKTLPLYGVQFHPESYMSEYGKELLGNWLQASEHP
ncbi:MAG: anthranilate synthase component II [[Pasteurella] mairii]|uniref:Putative anthranilate synthase component II n=1 Tax=[Pasteurella] mairii TaxID=757 RepID=A0A379B2F0_9PAST|nr:anthranilate synthase component II [[Pasteurella] mairii]SUB32696.1 putative anthranilate synthase component II [[Pasteurella] mairii]